MDKTTTALRLAVAVLIAMIALDMTMHHIPADSVGVWVENGKEVSAFGDKTIFLWPESEFVSVPITTQTVGFSLKQQEAWGNRTYIIDEIYQASVQYFVRPENAILLYNRTHTENVTGAARKIVKDHCLEGLEIALNNSAELKANKGGIDTNILESQVLAFAAPRLKRYGIELLGTDIKLDREIRSA